MTRFAPAARHQLVPRIAVVVLGFIVLACGQPPAPLPAPTAGPAATTASTAMTGTPGTSATTIQASAMVVPPLPTPAPAAGLVVGVVARVGGLSRPVAIANAGDGSGRLFVVEQAGRVRIVTRAGALVATPFLDIHARVSCCGERGLLGIAFHPAYRTNGRFYVSYTDPSGNFVVAEFRRTATNSNRASTTGRVLLRVPHATYPNHNGGGLAFGPDGYLYISTGDGGGAGDPFRSGQSRTTLLGKILRIAPNVTSATPAYRIPSTNPYAASAKYRHEIWAFGLRNPWRFSFDRSTGDLWIGDVGQDKWEEVDRALHAAGGGRGVNYGWSMWEARSCFRAPCTTTGRTFPLAAYVHSAANGCAIIGGYVYRGASYPAMRGSYLYADFCSGRIWRVAAGGAARQTPILAADTALAISAFGQDQAGELYVADYATGRIYRVTGH